MILSATSDDRLDTLCTQGAPSRLAVVSAIHDKDIRMTARSAALARNAGHIGDCRQCLCAVAGNRRRGVHDRRHAVSIHARACFVRSFLGSTGLGPVASSPPNPRIMTLSAIGNSAARMPAILSNMRKCMWRSSRTAAVFHRRSCPMAGAARTPKCEWHAFPTATSHQRVPQIL